MLRERISITLNPDLIKAIDQTVNGHSIRNRSHAIEVLIQEGLSINQFDTAFIFIAPGTTQPQIENVLEICHQSNLTNLFFCIQSDSSMTSDLNLPLLSQNDLSTILNGFIIANGWNCTAHFLPPELGEAGTLLIQKANIKSTFVVFHLDQSFNFSKNIWSAFSFHRKNGQLATTISAPFHIAQGTYTHQGITLMEPAVFDLLKIEQRNLQLDFFPEILKLGKLVTYIDITPTR